MQIEADNQIDFRFEIYRKLIHISSLCIPLIYYFIPKSEAVIYLSIATGLSLLLDMLRFKSGKIQTFLINTFGSLLRKHETDYTKKNLTGASYLLLAALIAVVIFPKLIAITVLCFLILGDTMAALVGRRYGKTRFLKKSLEGTFAFFVSTIVVVITVPKVSATPGEYLIGFLTGAIASVVENLSFGFFDDNLSIPVISGFLMWGLYFLLLPGYNLNLN